MSIAEVIRRVKWWIIFKLLKFNPYELNGHGYYVTSIEQQLIDWGIHD